ncbi:hypothetical protein BH11ACT6_BH11ACT6_33290 [soil metagenome]
MNTEPGPGSLADAVLPLIKTRMELYRRGAANGHGAQMHRAVDILETAVPTADPGEVYTVTHKALASAIKVIARADDSDGIIGDACRRLLGLHPKVAVEAAVPAKKLVDWMMRFQFDGDVDYFTLDPVAYAEALGDAGIAHYRARLQEREDALGPRPADKDEFSSGQYHERFTLEWNAQRLAVLDRDVDAIIRTHARDRHVAAWFHDTAKAFEEIGEFDLAIDWAKQATDFDLGHQSLGAASYWCALLDGRRPQESLEARLYVFRRWPSSSTAAGLHRAAGPSWQTFHDEVIETLSARPREAVLFVLLTLTDAEFAWSLAHSLVLDDDGTWNRLIEAYQLIDPVAVLPTYQRLVENQLVYTGPKHYRLAARWLATMRTLTAGREERHEVDAFIADLREQHRRRPRLQQEFDRARLP